MQVFLLQYSTVGIVIINWYFEIKKKKKNLGVVPLKLAREIRFLDFLSAEEQ